MDDVTPDMAAVAIHAAACIVVRLEDLEEEKHRYPNDPLPRGTLSYGEAMLLAGAVIALSHKAYPRLLEEGEAYKAALHSALLSPQLNMVS